MAIGIGAALVRDVVGSLLNLGGVQGNAFRRQAELAGGAQEKEFAAQLSRATAPAPASAPVVGEWQEDGTLFGDLNGDLAIDSDDLTALGKAFVTGDTKADLNNDGRVDTADLGLLVHAISDASGPATNARPQPALMGDFNGDGELTKADQDQLIAAFGTSDTTRDLNGDGAVDTADLGMLAMLMRRAEEQRQKGLAQPLPTANGEPTPEALGVVRRPILGV